MRAAGAVRGAVLVALGGVLLLVAQADVLWAVVLTGLRHSVAASRGRQASSCAPASYRMRLVLLLLLLRARFLARGLPPHGGCGLQDGQPRELLLQGRPNSVAAAPMGSQRLGRRQHVECLKSRAHRPQADSVSNATTAALHCLVLVGQQVRWVPGTGLCLHSRAVMAIRRGRRAPWLRTWNWGVRGSCPTGAIRLHASRRHQVHPV